MASIAHQPLWFLACESLNNNNIFIISSIVLFNCHQISLKYFISLKFNEAQTITAQCNVSYKCG